MKVAVCFEVLKDGDYDGLCFKCMLRRLSYFYLLIYSIVYLFNHLFHSCSYPIAIFLFFISYLSYLFINFYFLNFIIIYFIL